MKLMHKDKICLYFILFATAIIFSGCSSCKPVLYPNKHYKQVGSKQAKRDLEEVLQEAEDAGLDHNSSNTRALGRTAADTATRTGTSVALGAATGGIGPGTAISAGSAGASGLIRWMFSSNTPDPLFKRYVEMRLREKGYIVLGWK
jgi:hypothetical protein